MECPHCHTNLKYKERSNWTCSKCQKAFAFDPKYDPLKLHDVRFRRVVSKISNNDTFYFTPGQLLYFLSRGKIYDSLSGARKAFLVLGIISTIFLVIAIINGVISLIPFLIAAVFWILAIIYWRRTGALRLPVEPLNFQSTVLTRWQSVYKKLPPKMRVDNTIKHETRHLNHARGFLVCPDREILSCLAANQIPGEFGLILITPSAIPKPEADVLHKRKDLPIFVLHDASIEGCELRDKFVQTMFGDDQSRKVYDIGLRPAMIMKSKAIRLREKPLDSIPDLPHLKPEEKRWLKKGNYTPLLALMPAQLIILVRRAVERVQRLEAKNAEANEQKAAQAVGFMTWVGK